MTALDRVQEAAQRGSIGSAGGAAPARGAARAEQLVEHVARVPDDAGAGRQQPVAAGARSARSPDRARRRRPGRSGGEVGGGQRPRPLCGLDHDRQRGEARDDAVAGTKHQR